jgi:hypothetical protein
MRSTRFSRRSSTSSWRARPWSTPAGRPRRCRPGPSSPQTRLADLQIPRQRGDRVPLAGVVDLAGQLDRPSAELGGMRGRHTDSFLRPITSAQVSGQAEDAHSSTSVRRPWRGRVGTRCGQPEGDRRRLVDDRGCGSERPCRPGRSWRRRRVHPPRLLDGRRPLAAWSPGTCAPDCRTCADAAGSRDVSAAHRVRPRRPGAGVADVGAVQWRVR